MGSERRVRRCRWLAASCTGSADFGFARSSALRRSAHSSASTLVASDRTSSERIEASALFWCTVASAELAPSGATGDSSIGWKPAGSAANAATSKRASASGSAADGRAKRLVA